MFDVGFSELIVIGIVALVVIGPERLPRVARTVGHLLGRAQRYVNDVKSDINREIQLDELKKMQAQMQESMQAMEANVRKEVDSARLAVEVPVQETSAQVAADTAAPAEEVLTPTVATYGLADQVEAAMAETPATPPASSPTVPTPEKTDKQTA